MSYKLLKQFLMAIESKPRKVGYNIVTTFSSMENGKGALMLLNEFQKIIAESEAEIVVITVYTFYF